MMQPTAAHCRQQHAIQLSLALNEPLETRKQICLVAAAAWAKEAQMAEMREMQKASLSTADEAIAREFADEDAGMQQIGIQSRD